MNSSDTPESMAARMEQILGQPPRMPPLDRESVAEQVQAATNRLRGGVVGDAAPMPLDAIPEIMFTLCKHQDLWDRLMGIALQMQGATGLLEPRDRQLAILRTAWLLQAPYEWGEHVRHSRAVGLTSEDVARVIVGSAAPEWSPFERAIMRACEELRAEVMIGDETWAQLAQKLSENQLFELVVLIGMFTNTAYFQNALRLRLEPNNVGLTAR